MTDTITRDFANKVFNASSAVMRAGETIFGCARRYDPLFYSAIKIVHDHHYIMNGIAPISNSESPDEWIKGSRDAKRKYRKLHRKLKKTFGFEVLPHQKRAFVYANMFRNHIYTNIMSVVATWEHPLHVEIHSAIGAAVVCMKNSETSVLDMV